MDDHVITNVGLGGIEVAIPSVYSSTGRRAKEVFLRILEESTNRGGR